MKNPAPISQKCLLIIGAVHVDDIARPDTELVPKASNPVTWTRYIGGVAANAACSAARTLNKPDQLSVEFLAAVGDDATAQQLVQSLGKLNIHTRFKQFDNTNTGRYSAVMNHDGELYIGLSDVSLAERLNESMITELSDWTGVAAVVLDANLSQPCLNDLAKKAAEHKIPVAAMSVSPVKTQRLLALAQQIDLLICNRREAVAMLEKECVSTDLDIMAEGLIKLGFSQIVLTDGHEPILIKQGTKATRISVDHVDCTHHVNGAGDALAGATFAAWASGLSLIDAVAKFGIAASAEIVTGRYTPPLLDNPEGVNQV
ncbi:MAG: PfkB family carbohydrate kinase [Granulosicoccus sp.]